MSVIVNALLFQLTWFGCVMGGASGSWYWGLAGIAALLAFSGTQGTLTRDLRFVGVLIVVGFLLDSLWASTQVLDYGVNAQPLTGAASGLVLAPVWITLLWAGVGLTLMNSLNFFVARPWLGALMAGGASLPSYLAGERLGAVVVPEMSLFPIIMVTWGLLFFVMFRWANRVAGAGITPRDGESEAVGST